MLLLGPTGSGKTPLGEMLQARGFGQRPCAHFDFGAQLRALVQRNVPDERVSRDELAFLREVLASGALLENEHFPLARRILEGFLVQNDIHRETLVVLNGLPRHEGQARAVETLLKVGLVVHLVCSPEVVSERIQTDVGGDRAARADDTPAAIQKKLVLFERRTAGLLEYYRLRGVRVEVLEITARMTPRETWRILDARA